MKLKIIVAILHLEQGLSICDRELGDHQSHVKNHPVFGNVMMVGLLEDPSVLEHPKIRCRVAVIVGWGT
jgi:hypothetical protein